MAGTPNSEPAPWEEPGKRHTQMYGAGGVPGQPSPYPAAPQQPHPAGPRPAALQYPGAYPPAQGYQPIPGMAQPYGPAGYAQAYTMAKPTSGLAIAALVLAGVGFFGVGFLTWPLGILIGALALRQTSAAGPRSGRGMAVAGTIANVAFTLLTAAVVLLFVWVFNKVEPALKDMNSSYADGRLIVQRMDMYKRDHGDLSPGGYSFVGGIKGIPVSGPLRVEHLVGAYELKLPIERYSLKLDADGADVWYERDGNGGESVGRYSIHRGPEYRSSGSRSGWD